MNPVRRQLLSDHRDTVAAVIQVGERVAAGLGTRPVTDARQIRRPLRRRLDTQGLLEPVLELLVTGGDALGVAIAGSPVAAPPYLVVTSRGPICRGTLENGDRLVVELSLFSVERRPRRYRFRDPDIEGCLSVSRR